ncbi:hypothetical protein KKF84_10700 [Myxococcota bacterium]|nr:hypothetical protein [Myxococcota bacterium]MBU1535780.1 hypothetical protein [Myxococcota bacterium]
MLLILFLGGCTSVHHSGCEGDSCVDASPDGGYDVELPDIDRPDTEDARDGGDADGDVEEWPWITEYDPFEQTVTCEGWALGFGRNITIYYPYLFHHVYEKEEVGNILYMKMKLFRYNFETGENEELQTIPFITGGEVGGLELGEHPTNYFVGCKRTLEYPDPQDTSVYNVLEQECKTFIAQDVATGEITQNPVDVDLRSEDCITFGTSTVNVRQYDASSNRALLACNVFDGTGSDYYIFDFNTGEIEYLFRQSEDVVPYVVSSAHFSVNYYNSTYPYFMMNFGSNSIGFNDRIMVWNWVTGVLLWSLDVPEHRHVSMSITPTGLAYYQVMAQDANEEWYIQLRQINVETGKDEVAQTGSRNVLYPLVSLRDYPQYLTYQGTNVKTLSYSGAEPGPYGPSFIYLHDMERGIRRKISPNSVTAGASFLLVGTEFPRYVFYTRNTGCSFLKDLVAAGILDATGQLIYDPAEE